MLRGAHRRLGYTYDPYTVLRQLDEAGVQYILVGALARVLQGADEIPDDFDLAIPKGSRLGADEAILSFAMRAPPGVQPGGEAWMYRYRLGRSRFGSCRPGPRATATSAGAPSASTSAAASDHGSPRRAIWSG